MLFPIVALVCFCVTMWLVWDHIPGTLRFPSDDSIRGTGTLRQYYPSGSIKVEFVYGHGYRIRETWYRLDGSVFITSEFDVESGGTAYDLRDDGSLAKKFHCKFMVDPSGNKDLGSVS